MKSHLTELSGIRRGFVYHITLASGGMVTGAMETITPRKHYHWDGLRRGGDPQRPVWLFQYTLDGWGQFETTGQPQMVSVAQAFGATIPSAHRYFADPDCARWSFLWLMIDEPYVTQRLLGHTNLHNSVLPLAPYSPVIRSACGLLRQLARGDASDLYETEELMFRWMLECERWSDLQRYPSQPREKLLSFSKRYVVDRLESEIRTGDLAGAWGMDRSNFSHYFRKTTGKTPAAYIRTVKLEEASRLLRADDVSVKEVAAKTGFTDSNHLCKCFRRHFHLSPGSYRALHGKGSGGHGHAAR